MLTFIKRKLEKRALKKTFREYGCEIKSFNLDSIGIVEYAQWLHPFESAKEITNSNVAFYKKLVSACGTVVDFGTHTGATPVPMALAAGKGGLVIGLEPIPYV
jgi:hypothetical protein